MNDYADLTDEADQEWEHQQRDLEMQQWLQDEAAQKEYCSWLDLIGSTPRRD